MAKQITSQQAEEEKFSFTEHKVNEEITLIKGVSVPGRVPMKVGMKVTVDIREHKGPAFEPVHKDHGKNMIICGFSSVINSRTVRVHCCTEDDYKKSIATAVETGIPVGEQFKVREIMFVRCWIGYKRPNQISYRRK
jgi:hypothetical protein